MRPNLLFWLLCLLPLAGAGPAPPIVQRHDLLKKDSLRSSMDGTIQVFYYDKTLI